MKTILFLLIVSLSCSVRAGILAGPIVSPVNGHTYYLLSQNTWSNAEAEAVSMGGNLATIRNAAEERWVYSTFGGYGGALWIGLTDRKKVFSFQWVSGEPLTYTNWEALQPDRGTGGAEYYAHIWPPGSRSPGKWNDYLNVDNVFGFPLYGVVEITPTSTAQSSQAATEQNTSVTSNQVWSPPPKPLPWDRAFGFSLPSYVGLNYQIEASTDLVHWVPATNVALYFRDMDSTNYNQRFYRFEEQ